MYKNCGWPEEESSELKPYWTRRTEITIEVECLMWGMCVIILRKLQHHILMELH